MWCNNASATASCYIRSPMRKEAHHALTKQECTAINTERLAKRRTIAELAHIEQHQMQACAYDCSARTARWPPLVRLSGAVRNTLNMPWQCLKRTEEIDMHDTCASLLRWANNQTRTAHDEATFPPCSAVGERPLQGGRSAQNGCSGQQRYDL